MRLSCIWFSIGIFSLTAANTFTGVSTITGGTLRIGNGGTTGSIPATNQLVNSGAVEFNRTDKVTIPNSITNPGNNTAAGKVRINAGLAADPTTGIELSGTINTAAVAVGEFNNSFGRLFIGPSTNINTGTLFVGEQTGATGQVIQSGGSVTITGQFRVGHWPQSDPGGGFGTTSSYVLNSGSVTLTAAPGAKEAASVMAPPVAAIRSLALAHGKELGYAAAGVATLLMASLVLRRGGAIAAAAPAVARSGAQPTVALQPATAVRRDTAGGACHP